MGEQKMPNLDRDQSANSGQPGQQKPWQERDRASASDRSRSVEHDAARRQARQDPLQTRDR